jgi:hypothetical protein
MKNVESGKSQFGIWIRAYDRSPATNISIDHCIFKNVAEPNVLENVKDLSLIDVQTIYLSDGKKAK